MLNWGGSLTRRHLPALSSEHTAQFRAQRNYPRAPDVLPCEPLLLAASDESNRRTTNQVPYLIKFFTNLVANQILGQWHIFCQ